MEYHEAANFLFDLRRYPARTGVEPTRLLLEHLGNPGEAFRVVQVAGSNGKGSTARMLESVLREAGYSVGLFTSPHLDDLRERVRVDGRKVTKRAVCEFVREVEAYVADEVPDGMAPTFFESTAALAGWTFARADVDVGIFEVGIGGRHDATSAFEPVASAVTNVGLEHTDVLGDTIEEIATDKAAVAPATNPLVTAASGEALAAVEGAVAGQGGTGQDGAEQDGTEWDGAEQDGTEWDGAEQDGTGENGTAGERSGGAILRVGTDPDADVRVVDGGREGLEQVVSLSADGWSVDTRLPLVGGHQVLNAGVAAALAGQVGDVAVADLERGLRNAHWPGRFEVMGREPLVVLDGAHNPGSCEVLAETLSTFEFGALHLVFGAMADKDRRGMVEDLPAADRVYTCRPDFGRAETAETLAAVFDDDGRAGKVRSVGTVADAVSEALEAADPSDAVVVCGSLYVVAEARRRWTRRYVPTDVPDLETATEVLDRADVTGGGVRRMRGKGVHRVIATRVRPRQAEYLKQELLSLGGECATSGVRVRERELVDVVLMGTLAQFTRLIDALDGQSEGLPIVADELRDALELGDGRSPRRSATATGTGDGDGRYPWDDGTAVMGILNVTPDSFYDGGRYAAREDAIDRGVRMVEAGADVVDVGGESTRPGAEPVPVDEERDRVVPVVEALADRDVLVSVDTRKADVARAALEAGADVLNDVSGLADPEMRLVAAEHDVPVVVMHSIHTPVDPGVEVEYDDVVADTLDALTERVLLAEKVGLDRSQIIVDPGLGFGKSASESFDLLGRVGEFRTLGCPVMVGHSRKSMFSTVGADDQDDRLAATVAATALAAERGADIVRVHDVAENLAAVKTAAATAASDRFDD